MKLISMTGFVLEQKRPIPSADLQEADYYQQEYEVLEKVCNYANFLNQPLKLEMFVPCDEDGNVLKEPVQMMNGDCLIDEQYQQAKEKVLFEGFGIENEKFFDVSFYDVVRNKDTYVFVKDKEWEKVNDYNTIEDLVLYKLPLTPNAIKKITLWHQAK